jgi:predicted nucleic acid-binding Zn ribbon protein
MRYATRQQRLRHRLINQWRNAEGAPLQDLPTLTPDNLLPQILKTWKLDDRLRAEEMAAAWQEIVGTFVAQHTVPDGIKRAVLTIRLAQPAIHHTLMMKKAELLQRLQERFGEKTIKDIRFRHG